MYVITLITFNSLKNINNAVRRSILQYEISHNLSDTRSIKQGTQQCKKVFYIQDMIISFQILSHAGRQVSCRPLSHSNSSLINSVININD